MSTQLEPAAQANHLYWQTENSVADIAEQLNLSRRALYDLLQPVPTGARCAVCGGELVYENRSARTANDASCAQCGMHENSEIAAPAPQAANPTAIDPRTLRLGGAMIAGALLGVVATLVAVPRR